MPKRTETGLLIAIGAFVAALGLVFALDTLQWSLAGDSPGYSYAGAHAGVAIWTRLAACVVLLLVGVGVAVAAALRARRIK